MASFTTSHGVNGDGVEKGVWSSYRDVRECKEKLGCFFDPYNNLREHQSLDYNYPAEIYFGDIVPQKKAA
jgi:hypothetical protein